MGGSLNSPGVQESLPMKGEIATHRTYSYSAVIVYFTQIVILVLIFVIVIVIVILILLLLLVAVVIVAPVQNWWTWQMNASKAPARR